MKVLNEADTDLPGLYGFINPALYIYSDGDEGAERGRYISMACTVS